MPYQSGSNIVVAYKAQVGLGTPASGSGGLGLRFAKGSQGLRLMKQIIESEEVRRDGQSGRGRHGSKSAPSSYLAQLCVGELDTIFAAALRSSWTAAVNITQTAMTSITTTTSTIVAAAGSWLTQGVRIGDLVQLTGHAQAGNNGKWFRVLNVTASTITVPANSLTADAVADTSFTLTVAKTLISGATPTETYFTFDEHNQDIDASLVGTDVKVTRIEVVADPNRPIMVTIGLLGLDVSTVSGGSAPQLTSPTYATTVPLVLADGKIAINGVDVADLSGFRFVFDLGGNAPPVLAPTAPDVFLNNAKLSGSLSGMRTDLARFSAFRNETQIDFFAHCIEPDATDPKDFHSFYIGNAVYDGNDGPIGGEGALIESIPWRAGKDEAGGARASTMLKMSSSAA